MTVDALIEKAKIIVDKINIKKQYERSIKMQSVAREEMKKDIPSFEWTRG